MKKIFKQKKGITLIALVITIIILLILAGISITMLTGDNSILSKAEISKNKTKEASIYEQLDLVKTAWITEESTNTEATIGEFLQSAQEKGDIDSFTKEDDNKTYTITKNGFSRTIESPTYYTITKIYEDRTEKQKVKEGNNLGLITYREKSGYYFAGWSIEENNFSERSKFFKGTVSGNLMLYPKYVSNEIYLKTIKSYAFDSASCYFFFPVDSNILRYVGVNISINDGELSEKRGTCSRDFSATNENSGTTESYTSESLFGAEGYLVICIFGLSEFQINDKIELTPYWVTYDGVKVNSKTTTTFIYRGNGQFEEQ